MPSDPQRIQDVFLAAVEIGDPAERARHLDDACGGDTELRARVETLLRAHDQPDSLLDRPPVPLPGAITEANADFPVIGRPVGSAGDDDPLTFLGPPQMPGSLGRIGHYEILQLLGKGGFGMVFRAFDEVLQRVVALKVLLPQIAATSPARKRFLREARSSAAVRNEHVVRVHEVGETPLPYIVMEFIPGETLQQRLDRTGPLDVADVLRIGRQIAEGLAAAHATDLIHRDIKPGNILLEGGHHTVRITDFGLARAADDASISQSGIIAGTPMYMAPEQAKGETLDQRADLFSLGSVLYVMAAGRPPFRASGSLAVLKRVAEDNPRPIREIIPETPPWLCDIIATLHRKDPADRYQTAREVADVLAACETELRATGRVKSAVIRLDRRPPVVPRRRWPWVAAAGVLLAVLGVVVAEATGVTHLFRGPPRAATDPLKPETDPTPVAAANPPARPVEAETVPAFKNGIGMEFILVPKGKSWRGGGKDRLGDPEVLIPADFYLGRYEVTQEEWETVMGENPSHFARAGERSDAVKGIPDADLKRFPVDNVSWDQCQVFVAKLNQKEKGSGWVYRLPTEAEWEYACRGGPMANKLDSAFDFYFAKPTNTPMPDQGNINYGTVDNPVGLHRTCKVGSSPPNALGLHDLHGSLWEWCGDAGTNFDGTPGYVIRGGSWSSPADECTAAFRDTRLRTNLGSSHGVRVARVQAAASEPKAAEADRTAAEAVLALRGSVRINEQERELKALGDLPREPFRLTGVVLSENKQLTDAGLAAFKGCQHLATLDLSFTGVGDEGLAHLATCRAVTSLDARFTKLTNAGLAHVGKWKNLAYLNLTSCDQVTDAGLIHLSGCKELKNLALDGTQVTDAGLAHLKGCGNLRELHLPTLPITDDGLKHLAGLSELTELNLTKTRVTAKGAEGLGTALPKCRIAYEGGVIEPK